MALVLADRVRETTTTTGTGTVSLAGPVSGFQGFSTAIGNANTTYYTIADAATGAWEVGLGTYTSSGSTLARTTILSSSNAGAAVNFAAGTKDVFVTQPAERALYLNGAGTGIDAGVASFTANGVVYASSASALATGSGLTWNGTNLFSTGSITLDTNLGIFFSGAGVTSAGVYGRASGTEIAFNASGAEKLRLTSTSLYTASGVDVGIGTPTPAARLDVSQSQNGQTAVQLTNSNAGASAEATFIANNGTYIGSFGVAGASKSAFGAILASDAYIFSNANVANTGITLMANSANGVIKFATGGSAEKMRLNSAGTLSLSLANGQMGFASGNTASGVKIQAFNAAGNADGYLAFEGFTTEYGRFDASGNLGIGTSSPDASFRLTVGGNSAGVGPGVLFTDSAGSPTNYALYTNGSKNFVLRNQAGGGVTGDIWTATPAGNVGIGASSPAYRLDVIQDGNSFTGQRIRNNDVGSSAYAGLIINANGNSWGMRMGSGAANSNRLELVLDALGTPSIKATLDSAGNLGLGVTPSAWDTGNSVRALQLNGGSLWSYAGFGLGLINNAFYASTGAYIYRNNGFALDYFQSSSSGDHIWRIAPSGTAGNTITFTQAMTLDGSGRLLVGATAQGTYGGNTAEFRGANIATLGANVTGNLTLFTTDSQAANVGAVLAMGGIYAGTTPYAFGAIAARKSNSTSGNAEGYLQFYTTDSTNAIVERARIDASGNLGVGATSPSTYGKFVVEGTGSFTSAMVSTSSTLTDKPTLEFRKTTNVTSGQTSTLGRISFNGKFGSTAGEQAYLSVVSTNSSDIVDLNEVKLATRAVSVGADTAYLSLTSGGNITLYGSADSGTLTYNSGGFISNANTHKFKSADNTTEYARITSGGDLLVGTTGSGVVGCILEPIGRVQGTTGAVGTACFQNWNQATSGDNTFQQFYTEGGGGNLRGSITYNRAGGLVAYNVTSDYRAKDIYGPVVGSGAVIDSVPVYMGKMKDATQERPMFIAHEVPAYAHTGEKDAVDAEGNPVYQQMDASALIPVMWAEIQSLRQRLATLESSTLQ